MITYSKAAFSFCSLTLLNSNKELTMQTSSITAASAQQGERLWDLKGVGIRHTAEGGQSEPCVIPLPLRFGLLWGVVLRNLCAPGSGTQKGTGPSPCRECLVWCRQWARKQISPNEGLGGCPETGGRG